jgi:hypothetical protein
MFQVLVHSVTESTTATVVDASVFSLGEIQDATYFNSFYNTLTNANTSATSLPDLSGYTVTAEKTKGEDRPATRRSPYMLCMCMCKNTVRAYVHVHMQKCCACARAKMLCMCKNAVRAYVHVHVQKCCACICAICYACAMHMLCICYLCVCCAYATHAYAMHILPMHILYIWYLCICYCLSLSRSPQKRLEARADPHIAAHRICYVGAGACACAFIHLQMLCYAMGICICFPDMLTMRIYLHDP